MTTRQPDATTRNVMEWAASKHGVDVCIMIAIMNLESSVRPWLNRNRDTGGQYAFGPMQMSLVRAIDVLSIYHRSLFHPDTITAVELTRRRNVASPGPEDPVVSNPWQNGSTNLLPAAYGGGTPVNEVTYENMFDQVFLIAQLHVNMDLAAAAIKQTFDQSLGSTRGGLCGTDATQSNVQCWIYNYQGGPAEFSPGNPPGPTVLGRSQRGAEHYLDCKGGSFLDFDGTNTNRTSDPPQPILEGECTTTDIIFPDGYYLPPSPHHATFYAKIGGIRPPDADGISLTSGGFELTPSRPQYVEYFEYVDEFGFWIDKWTIRAFDPSWDIVTGNAILALADTGRTLERNQLGGLVGTGFENSQLAWGYSSFPSSSNGFGVISPTKLEGGAWAPLRAALLLEYEPYFMGYGVEMRLSGLSGEAAPKMTSSTHTFPGEFINHRSAGLPRGVRTESDIVIFLAEELGWQFCVRETEEKTESNELKKYTMTNRDPLSFIYNNLVTYATAKDDANAHGYIVRYEPATNTLHFHPPVQKVTRRYIYSRGRSGTIISFRPTIQPFAAVVLGGFGLAYSGFDQETMQPFEGFVDHRNSQSRMVSGQSTMPAGFSLSDNGAWEPDIDSNIEDLVSGIGSVINTTFQRGSTGYGTKALWEARMKNAHQALSWAAVGAELVVQGDPTIRSQTNIHVTVFGKGGPQHEHWASGTYLIQRATHVIERGIYTTTLTLMRNALPDEAKIGTAVQKGEIVPTTEGICGINMSCEPGATFVTG